MIYLFDLKSFRKKIKTYPIFTCLNLRSLHLQEHKPLYFVRAIKIPLTQEKSDRFWLTNLPKDKVYFRIWFSSFSLSKMGRKIFALLFTIYIDSHSKAIPGVHEIIFNLGLDRPIL